MPTPSDIYYGTYARFETSSKKDASALLGADNLVGDLFDIEFKNIDGVRHAWMKNKFGALVGYFDANTSRELSLLQAKNWKIHSYLSVVVYSEQPAPGIYWGEAAIICFDPSHADAFEAFAARVADRLGDGVRLDVDLGKQGAQQVVDSKGEWAPKKLVPFPKKKAGSALLKTKRSSKEKMIEQARKGNKGCYFMSWVVLLGLVAAIIFGLRSCGVF